LKFKLTTLRSKLIKVAKEILQYKYPTAEVLFLAGSIVRGEGTPHSDLDLVVIFDSLSNAYRESFLFQGFPVEAFVHDPETFNYFLLEVDRPSGVPSLAQMILEGIELPEPGELSQSLRELAASVIQAGPPELSAEDVRKFRYNLTNLVDDIRQPRSTDELLASGTELYEALADYYFRTNNLWSAKGKAIPRTLKQADCELCLRYCKSFEELFSNGDPEKVIALVEELLVANGGFLFDGHRLEAPTDYRKPLAERNRAAQQIVGSER
jgi:nucleotidyltransferase-like protein